MASAMVCRSIALAIAWRTFTSLRIGEVPLNVMCRKFGPPARRMSTPEMPWARLQVVDVRADVDEVDLAVGEGVDLRVEVDDAVDDPVEDRLVAPPLRVAGQRDRLRGLVDRLDLERAGGLQGLVDPARVEDVRVVVGRRRVQRAEQRLPVGVGVLEGDDRLLVAVALLDRCDLVVAGGEETL